MFRITHISNRPHCKYRNKFELREEYSETVRKSEYKRRGQLIQNKQVKVPAEVKGRTIIRTKVMMLIQCKLNEAHHVYRFLYQTVAKKLRLGMCVFDVDGCKYPDR